MSDPTTNDSRVPLIWGPLGRKFYDMNPNRPPNELEKYGITPPDTPLSPDGSALLSPSKAEETLYPPEGS
jgi:hypothetical protein